MFNVSYYKIFRKLFAHNIEVNGLRAMIYPFGLSASRYIEYAAVLDFYNGLDQDDLMLEVGCGHSILPTLWERLGLKVIAIDTNKKALKWQVDKSKKIANKLLQAVLADARNLPFRGRVFPTVSCISTIEHFPNNGDTKANCEIGTVLKPNGLYVVSFPLSIYQKSYSKKDWASGIPPLIKRLLESSLPAMFKKFNIDRTSSYFERMYSLEDMRKRIIVSSSCALEDYVTLLSKPLVKILHGRIIPTGVLTILEYILARAFMIIGKSTVNMDAIVLKLRR